MINIIILSWVFIISLASCNKRVLINFPRFRVRIAMREKKGGEIFVLVMQSNKQLNQINNSIKASMREQKIAYLI